MDIKLLELYSDYIISSFGQITATGLSRALSGSVSHDKITRFLAKNNLNSKELWKLVKPVIREEEQEDGVLIVDDTIEKKPHTTESELICWHHDHQSNRSVKGVNIINYVYSVEKTSLPVGFDIITKPIGFCEVKTKREKRRATVTKNELTRNQLKICRKNQLKYKYVLTDSWFSSQENMTFIRHDLNKHFIMAIKSNRSAMPNRQRSCRNAPAFVAISEDKKKQGHFTRIDSLSWSSQKSVRGWLKGLDFPVQLHRQVFTNKDGSTGILYLACSDFNCNVTRLEAIYARTVESGSLS